MNDEHVPRNFEDPERRGEVEPVFARDARGSTCSRKTLPNRRLDLPVQLEFYINYAAPTSTLGSVSNN